MIKVNVATAKEIAHDKRRQAREQEFEPLDKMSMIPMYAEQAENQRQAVRDKYAEIQAKIDQAGSVDDLKAALDFS